jgi:hypothetical protein
VANPKHRDKASHRFLRKSYKHKTQTSRASLSNLRHNNSLANTSSSKATFLGLPADIRSHVYAKLLHQLKFVWHGWPLAMTGFKKLVATGVLPVCRMCVIEAKPVFFACITHSFGESETMKYLASHIGDESVSLIRHLLITDTFCGNDFNLLSTFPAFEDITIDLKPTR